MVPGVSSHTAGLDSLLAPFLTLNFDREARSYWCLHALTSRYLPNFFLPDNTIPLQEHLATFRQLLAYHGTTRTLMSARTSLTLSTDSHRVGSQTPSWRHIWPTSDSNQTCTR